MDLQYKNFHKEFVKKTMIFVNDETLDSAQDVANVFHNMIASNCAVYSKELDLFQDSITAGNQNIINMISSLENIYFPKKEVDQLYQQTRGMYRLS
ncbi:MAG: hypothetical protein ACQESC_04795 [Nanobdellota archaeon]